MPAPGPWLVADIVGIFLLLGVVTGAVACVHGKPFLPWALHGASVPVVGLPGALAGARDPGRATTVALVLVLAATNVVLVSFHRTLFGSIWQYVMWEGGVVEVLTPINFLFGAVVFVLAAWYRRADVAARNWLALFALTDVGLAGEEVSWGRGQILLDLNDPNFERRYNVHYGLHFIAPALAPIIVFFIVVALLRIFRRHAERWLRLPLPVGFLNAVLATAPAALLMDMSGEKHLFVDEVYEWSGSVLLLCLALHARWGWFFRPAPPRSRR